MAKSRILHITETQKRSKLSDILSFFLTLTWLREGLQPQGLQPPLWLRPCCSASFYHGTINSLRRGGSTWQKCANITVLVEGGMTIKEQHGSYERRLRNEINKLKIIITN